MHTSFIISKQYFFSIMCSNILDLLRLKPNKWTNSTGTESTLITNTADSYNINAECITSRSPQKSYTTNAAQFWWFKKLPTPKMNINIVSEKSKNASQCRTAVLHCCKGDAASQWEMAILGVSELRNPWTDRLKIWLTWLRRWDDLVC